jgi:hypothetical protein
VRGCLGDFGDEALDLGDARRVCGDGDCAGAWAEIWEGV